MTAALAAHDLSVRLGGSRVLDQVSLDLQPGRFVALIGPNGAGKTTLLKALAGLIPAEGTVSLGGTPLATLSRAERARRIAYLPQGHHVHWPLSAHDVIALGRFPHGLSDTGRPGADHARAIASAMARTDTASFADRQVQTLSGGERARVMLARVLAVEAPVLLADEPTASLDPRHQITVMDQLKAESRRGALVVAVTHDIGLAARMADEVVLLDGGRLAGHGTPEAVLSDELLASVYGITVQRQMIDGETWLTPWGLA